VSTSASRLSKVPHVAAAISRLERGELCVENIFDGNLDFLLLKKFLAIAGDDAAPHYVRARSLELAMELGKAVPKEPTARKPRQEQERELKALLDRSTNEGINLRPAAHSAAASAAGDHDLEIEDFSVFDDG
jgi:hypothetical protein